MGETNLDHLSGFMDSKPVRIGVNKDQFQLDIYGALLDSIYLYNKYAAPVSYDMWIKVREMLDWICNNWKREDQGIWAMRSKKQHFVHSKLMCWVALDRGLRLASKRSFPNDQIKGWLETRDKIFEEIMVNGWSEKQQSFAQAFGSNALDASVLMMPLVLFLSGSDPRMVKTVESLQKPKLKGGLMNSTLMYRYNLEETDDGLEGEEGTHIICSFWLIEALTRMGNKHPEKLQEARYKLEDMFSFANHLGLFSEKLCMTGRQLGNFPQGFAHIAMISASYNLNRALRHES